MSIRVMTQVWDCNAYEGGTLLVLLAMADWADDTGGNIFPKMEKLANKARLSVRGAQLCVAKLKEDGVIAEVAPSRRGRGTEYKIVLERVKELHRNDCTAMASGEDGGSNGVQSATVGVKSDASYIDNHQEPLSEPSSAGAREEALKRWPEIWAAFQAWPHLPDTTTEGRARATWERMLGELPEVDDLVGRIRAQAAKLRISGAKGRGGWATAPHNWLERDRGWADLAPATKVDDSAVRALLGGAAGKLVDALGPGGAPVVDAWFRDALFDAGPPIKIIFPKAWRRDQVAQRYGGALKRAFGEDFILEAAA